MVRKNNQKVFGILIPIVIFAFIWASWEFFAPIFFSDKGLSIGQIAVFFAISSFFGALTDIPCGKFSDIVGRKKALLLAVAITIFVFSILRFTDSLAIIFGLALFEGLAYSFAWPSMLAYIGDVSRKGSRGRRFGSFFFWADVGEIMAPLVIVLFLSFIAIKNVIFTIVFFSIISFIAFLWLNEKKNGKISDGFSKAFLKKGRLNNYFKDIKKGGWKLLLFLLIGLNYAYLWEVIWFSEPLIGFSEGTLFQSALIVAFFSLPFLIFSKPVGNLIDKIGKKKVLLMSLIMIAPSMFLFSMSQSLILSLSTIFITAIGSLGTIEVLDVALSDSSRKNTRGEFFGIVETAKDFGYAIAPLIIAFLVLKSDFGIVFLSSATLTTILIPLVALTKKI